MRFRMNNASRKLGHLYKIMKHRSCLQCTPKFRQLILGVFFMGIINKSKYPDCVRMRAIAGVLDDFRSYCDVAREFGVDHKTVRQWVSQSSSVMHYAGKGCYDGDFKLRVSLGKRLICWRRPRRSVSVRSARSLSGSFIYAARGAAGLYEHKPRGRPPQTMGRVKKKEPQMELEKLQAENAYLKAEVALLKK